MKSKTRNRSPKPAWTFRGTTADLWRADNQRVVWAQTSPQFAEILTVLINERSRALRNEPTTTENCRLGRVQGYEEALEVLRSLATGLDNQIVSEPRMEYLPADETIDHPTD